MFIVLLQPIENDYWKLVYYDTTYTYVELNKCYIWPIARKNDSIKQSIQYEVDSIARADSFIAV